jgi:hypothetical protein
MKMEFHMKTEEISSKLHAVIYKRKNSGEDI